MVGLKHITKKNINGNDWQFNRSWSQSSQTTWKTFYDGKLLTWELEETKLSNILQRVNNIVPAKSVKLVIIHCSTNNIDTSNSDKISLSIFGIARSISYRQAIIKALSIKLSISFLIALFD